MDSDGVLSFFNSNGPLQNEEEEDLEDLGLFDLGVKTPFQSEAKSALNELGLNPSPPRFLASSQRQWQDASSNHEADGELFDLDHELEMEELHKQEERSQPTPYDDDDEELEDDCGLNGESEDSSVQSSPTITKNVLQAGPLQIRPVQMNAIATSSRHPIVVNDQPEEDEEEEEQLGINGLPKYIPAGIVHTVLLDGTSARFERRKRVTAWKPKPAHYGAGPVGLLSRPVHQIIERVEAMRALQVVNENEIVARGKRNSPKQTPEMWQERYRPSRFTELIGEERTHREVMSWLKSWDTCVFGKSSGKKRFRETQEKPAFAGYNGGGPLHSNFVKDKWDRPKERILLLGGPAGMGKTTLAHVAARSAGYLVHEINASDDRSARTVDDRVRDALESNSLQGNRSKQPTCLILDEVDGATGGGNAGGDGMGGGGFVRALIKLVGQRPNENEKKKGGKKGRPLLRPIICVCNDPYAPALRALRPFSKLVRLNRPSTPALMARLRQICEQERIRHDSAGLILLISLCQGDLRSCLNALQLVQSDPRGITAATMQGGGQTDANGLSIMSALSIKDGNSNIHQVWLKLFRAHTSKERDRQRGAKLRAKNSVPGDDLHEVVSSVISSGEMDKILAGCFEHYTNLKLVDDGWWRFRKMYDWMYWYEHLNQRGWESGFHNEIWSYLPWSFVGWKTLFANTANTLPEYPRIDYQNYLKRTAFDEVIADVQACMPLSTRSQFDKISLITELGPMLVPLLSPDIKPINAQVIQSEEKRTLASCVSLMNHLNIEFVMDKNEQGHPYYKFEPPLEAFAHFEGKRVASNTGNAARFNIRQLITSELRALQVREKQSSVSQHAKKDAEPQPKQAPVNKAKGAVDFFGRPIAVKEEKKPPLVTSLPQSILAKRQEKENVALDKEADNLPAAKRPKLKVFYHYHEGYSNAVRKPIKMSDLLA